MSETPMVLPAPTDISVLKDRYLAEDRQERAQQKFYSEISGIFAAYPDVQTISFVFYTPWGFNDGDPQTPNFYSSVNGHGYYTVKGDGSVSSEDDFEDDFDDDFYEAFNDQDEYIDEYDFYTQVYKKGDNPAANTRPEVPEAAQIVEAMYHTLDAALGEGIALRFDRIEGVPFLTHNESYDSEY